VYFALYNGNTGQERLYVIEGVSQDPQGEYVFKAKLNIETDRWAIDGSILRCRRAKIFIWTGWDGDRERKPKYLHRRNERSWTLIPTRRPVASRIRTGKKSGILMSTKVRSADQQDKVFIIYSASGSWTDDYCSSADVSVAATR
jgi:GH43 family beta-xylosidase